MSRPSRRRLPRVDLGQAGDHAQQRRLAAARRADEDDELALLDREVDALDRAAALPKCFSTPCSSRNDMRALLAT